jgi:hypothetical protein
MIAKSSTAGRIIPAGFCRYSPAAGSIWEINVLGKDGRSSFIVKIEGKGLASDQLQIDNPKRIPPARIFTDLWKAGSTR